VLIKATGIVPVFLRKWSILSSATKNTSVHFSSGLSIFLAPSNNVPAIKSPNHFTSNCFPCKIFCNFVGGFMVSVSMNSIGINSSSVPRYPPIHFPPSSIKLMNPNMLPPSVFFTLLSLFLSLSVRQSYSPSITHVRTRVIQSFKSSRI